VGELREAQTGSPPLVCSPPDEASLKASRLNLAVLRIETTKVEGTDNVYVFRHVNHQAMFIVTSAGVTAMIRSLMAGLPVDRRMSKKLRRSLTNQSSI
jgi:hypothetical protein